MPHQGMPEIELMRARELAIASGQANQLFWIMVIGTAAVIVFWSLVRWRILRLEAMRRRELGASARRQPATSALMKGRAADAAAWEKFCKRNGLSENAHDAKKAAR
jgi:hypothetical protein